MKSLILPTAIVACLLCTVALAEDQPSLDAVDALVEPHVGKEAPGLAVLVMKKGKVLHMQGYGEADIEADTPVDENTVFDLASVSKQMTDLALMLLIEEGKVSLDTPLEDILPVFEDHKTGERPLVVNDLVRHISGLPDYYGSDDGFDYKLDTTNDEIVAWLATQPLKRSPGTQYEYSNSGYIVLANVVATLGGTDDLAEFLEKRVFTPLGMDDTGVVEPTVETVAKGYKGEDGSFEISHEDYVIQGDGGVMTNIKELALYEEGLVFNKLLDADATQALCTNATMDDGSPLQSDEGGYGFGWTIDKRDGEDYCWHDGSWDGTRTAYVRNITTGVTAIVLANGEAMAPEELAFEIVDAVE